MKFTAKGVGLIETLIVVGVAGVVGVLLITALIQNNGLFFQQTTRINQGRNLNDTNLFISDMLQAASSVALNYPGNPQYTSDQSSLVLSLPSYNASGNVIEGTYDYVVIRADTTNPKILRGMVFPNAASSRKSANQVLTTTLSQVKFTYKDNASQIVSPAAATKVNFYIVARTQGALGVEEASTSGEINLRNI